MATAPPRVHVLTSHLDPGSLTVAVARRVEDALRDGGASVTSENVALSGFVTAYRPDDLAAYRRFLDGKSGSVPSDVAEQQTLLEASDALVVVFPVYWWSVPGELKGWVDRVFTGGWSWGRSRAGRAPSALAHLDVHVVPLVGSAPDLYERHGYTDAMMTQIDHGILEYNGVRSSVWTWLWDAANQPAGSLERAEGAARAVLDGLAASGGV